MPNTINLFTLIKEDMINLIIKIRENIPSKDEPYALARPNDIS